MKRPFFFSNSAGAALITVTLFLFLGCPDPIDLGKKTLRPTKVGLKVTGLATSVTQSFAGDFTAKDNWKNSDHTFTLTDGSGRSEDVVIDGAGSTRYLSFTMTDADAWTKAWNEAGQFGTNDDAWDHLNNFVVEVPLDGKTHLIDVDYPVGWNTPKITVDGAAPSNLVFDGQGHLTAVKRPFGASSAVTQTEEFTYDGDQLQTWTRHFGYRSAPQYSQSVWTFENGKLVKTVDTVEAFVITRTFDDSRPDLNAAPASTVNARVPLTTSERQTDRVVAAGFGSENGEPTWNSLAITPTAGVVNTVSVPAGTLSMAELLSEGWTNHSSVWPSDGWNTDQKVAFVGPAEDKRLKASFMAPFANHEAEARFIDFNPRLTKWSGYGAVTVEAVNSGEEAFAIQLFIETHNAEGAEVWQQTRRQVVGLGATTIVFDLSDIQSEAAGWQFDGTPLSDPDSVFRFGFTLSQFSKAGSVELDDFKLVVANPDSAVLSTGSVPDAALRARLEAATGRQFGSTLTRGVAKTLEWLGAEDTKGITDLTGLDQFSSLRELSLNQNTVNLGYLTPQRFPMLRQIGVQQYDWDNDAARFTLSQLRTVLKAFPRWDQVHIGSLKDFSNADWNSLYTDVYYPNRATLQRIELDAGDSSTLDTLAGIGDLTNLEVLQINGNRRWSDLASLAPLTKLWHLGISRTHVTDLQPLKSLFDAGAFQRDDTDPWVNAVELEDVGLDLTAGSANRVTVDYLRAHGVTVEDQYNALTKVSVPGGSITVDGGFSDWSGKPATLTDPSGDGGAFSALDFTAVTLVSGAGTVGIRYQGAGSAAPAVTEQYGGWLHFRPLLGDTGVDIEVVHFPNEDHANWTLYSRSWDPVTREEGELVSRSTDGLVEGVPGDWEIAVPKTWLLSGTLYRVWFDTNTSSGGGVDLDNSYEDPVFVVF